MKAIIIEDEKMSAQALEKLINKIAPEIRIDTVLQTIEESVEWFESHPMPDVAFMDIHLADGSSFSIFEKTEVSCPIIFTTAYDEYALKAFKVNSVDYLLKPISQPDIERAIQKLRNRSDVHFDSDEQNQLISKLASSLFHQKPVYKSSFLIAFKDMLIPLPVNDIAYIYIENKIIKAVRFNEKSCVLDLSMEELSAQLDPNDFFRANRQYIVSRKAVKNISLWFGNRMAINLILPSERILVSRTHVKELKEWITQ